MQRRNPGVENNSPWRGLQRQTKRRIHEGEASSSGATPTEAAAAGKTVTPTVPEMDQDNLIRENSDDESESNEESQFDEQEIFDDYMVSLPLDDARCDFDGEF